MSAENEAPPKRPCRPPRRRGAAVDAAALARLQQALHADLFQPAQDAAPAAEPPDENASEPAAAPGAATDDLPEYLAYRDEGCHVAPACLRCPLPRCIFDREVGAARAARGRRDRHIRALGRRGWSTERLAARFGLSATQVRRIRAASRRKPSDSSRPRPEAQAPP